MWEEETKFIVSVNGNKVDFLQGAEIELKPGDQIVVCRPGKGGKKGRNWHVSYLVLKMRREPLLCSH